MSDLAAKSNRDVPVGDVVFSTTDAKVILRYSRERNRWEVPEGVDTDEAARAIFATFNSLWSKDAYTVLAPVSEEGR